MTKAQSWWFTGWDIVVMLFLNSLLFFCLSLFIYLFIYLCLPFFPSSFLSFLLSVILSYFLSFFLNSFLSLISFLPSVLSFLFFTFFTFFIFVVQMDFFTFDFSYLLFLIFGTILIFQNIATTVFTPLELGTVGLSEEAAIEMYGEGTYATLDSLFCFRLFLQSLIFFFYQSCWSDEWMS